MDINKIEKMKNGKGFIAALDQSGGSIPKALMGYEQVSLEHYQKD